MSVASALVAGNDPLPGLAEQALAEALEKTGARQANGVLLFLTPEFSRHAQQTVIAVARAARCTQLVGGIAAGVFTDSGWVLDRPAAAVLVLAGDLSLGPPDLGVETGEPLLAYGDGSFPGAWAVSGRQRFGGSFAGNAGRNERVAWQQGRLAAHCSVQVLGAHVDVDVSPGWRLLGGPHAVDSSRAYELLGIGGYAARDSLLRALQAAGYSAPQPAMRSLCAVLVADAGSASAQECPRLLGGTQRSIAIIDISDNGSVTLAERIAPGQRLAWAIRLPQAAVDDMRQSVARLAALAADPQAAVVFSCIGRGPYFHDGEDRDVDCLRERFPELPLIGVYGTGQIAPNAAGGNRLLQNAVVTALLSQPIGNADVQSEP